MSTLQRISYGGEKLGDYAFVTISYAGNNSVRIIPRAIGVKIYSTTEMGGGQQTFAVRLLILKSTRQDIEKYQVELSQLEPGPATLEIYDKNGSNPVVYTNCYLSRVSPSTEDELWSWIDLEFVRSI